LFSTILADIYDELDTQLEEYGLVCECLGGGKIYHDSSSKEIEVYGKSQVGLVNLLFNFLLLILS